MKRRLRETTPRPSGRPTSEAAGRRGAGRSHAAPGARANLSLDAFAHASRELADTGPMTEAADPTSIRTPQPVSPLGPPATGPVRQPICPNPRLAESGSGNNSGPPAVDADAGALRYVSARGVRGRSGRDKLHSAY